MYEFIDAAELFVGIVNGLRQKQISFNSSLDEILLKASKTNLAYIDNRRDANVVSLTDLYIWKFFS